MEGAGDFSRCGRRDLIVISLKRVLETDIRHIRGYDARKLR